MFEILETISRMICQCELCKLSPKKVLIGENLRAYFKEEFYKVYDYGGTFLNGMMVSFVLYPGNRYQVLPIFFDSNNKNSVIVKTNDLDVCVSFDREVLPSDPFVDKFLSVLESTK